MLAAGGAALWAEVLAATSGQQKRLRGRFVCLFLVCVVVVFFLKIGLLFLDSALHASQDR